MIQTERLALVGPDPEANISDLLLARVAATPDGPLFAVPDADGGWREVTAREFHRQVVSLAKGFVAAGLNAGDRVGLLCKVRYEWTLIDFAAAFAGIVLVPIYETSSPLQIRHLLTDSAAVAVVLETAEHVDRLEVADAAPGGPLPTWVIEDDDLATLAASGARTSDDELEQRRRMARGDDVATIIYTSGSTGAPKGCILTHANIVELSRNAAAAMPEVVAPGASTLLFITTAHVFARFISILCVHSGVKVGHQADTTQLLPAISSFRPTFLLAVPRVFEKIYNSAEQKAEASRKGRIFRAAADTAVAHSEARDAGSVPWSLRLRFALFRPLVYRKLTQAMGGRVIYAISGSAPLGTRLGHFFRSLGIQILEGYGLTETTAPATVNLVGASKIGTVGRPLPGVGLRIDDEGEILIRGINVFAGYWNTPDVIGVFDDGWFRTGDLGQIDDDGYLTITGRKKEIIVTAGGKNVAPARLEDPIRANPIISQVVVVGDRKPFISALITLDHEMLPLWLANAGEPADLSPAAAATHPKVRDEVQRAIDAANAIVSRAESIRKFLILPTELTEASGHLTPKLSIKRQAILNDFTDEIEAMYDGA